MARFFKCYGPDHPLFEPIYKKFGPEGYGIAVMVVAQADAQGVYHMDHDRLARWGNIRKPKAEKMLPLVQEMLKSYASIVEQSGTITQQYSSITQQYPSIVEQSDCTTAVHDPSNPCGSIKEERIERTDQREESSEPVGSTSSRQTIKFEDRHMVFAKEFYELVVAECPYYKPPKYDIWANDVRLLEEVDGFSIEKIEDVAAWVFRESEFWRKNIRSPAKLRKHFSRLIDQSGMHARWNKQHVS